MPNLAAASASHATNLVPDGRVLVTAVAASTAVYALDPKGLGWTRLGDLQLARSGHAAIVTADGLLALFGGAGTGTTARSIEIIHL